MRYVNFEEIGMENYGPYIEQMIIEVSPNIMTLITGKNGIGKTMLLDALPYTLFGVTSKKAKGDDVVNNVVEKNCKTWVKFSIDSDKYLITRYHKYTRLGNTVILNKNGVDVLKGQREVLPEIEKIICSQKAFMNTLMFGQKVKDFFTDLVDSDKKEIFRKILNLEIYAEYYKIVDEKLKELMKSLTECDNKIDVNGQLLEDTLNQIKILQNAKEEYEKNHKQEIDELKRSLDINEKLLSNWIVLHEKMLKNDLSTDKIVQTISNINSKLSNLESQKTGLENELTKQKNAKKAEINSKASQVSLEINKTFSNKFNELNKLKNKVTEVRNDYSNNTKDKLHDIEKEKQRLESTILYFQERITEIQTHVLDSDQAECPTCEQEVTEEISKNLISKIQSYKENIETIKLQIEKLVEQSQNINKKFKDEMSKYDDQSKVFNDEEKRIEDEKAKEEKTIDDRLNVALNKLDELFKQEVEKTSKNLDEQISNLKKEKLDAEGEKKTLELLQQDLKDLETKINNLQNDIKSCQDKITTKEEQKYDDTHLKTYTQKEKELITNADKLIHDKEFYTSEIETFQFWKSAFSPSGIPSMLIDESIPFMNKKISEYLDLLTNGRYIVSFDTLGETKAGDLKDKIEVRVIDTFTKANSRIQLSGGQTRLIDIATILTLGDLQTAINNVTFNLLLFDEIFDALDYDNVGYVSKILNQIKLNKSIFIISHQHQDQLEPDETLALS